MTLGLISVIFSVLLFILLKLQINLSDFLMCFGLKDELWVMAFICDGSFYFHFNSYWHLKPDSLIIILMVIIGLLIQPNSKMLQYFTTKHFTPEKKNPKAGSYMTTIMATPL